MERTTGLHSVSHRAIICVTHVVTRSLIQCQDLPRNPSPICTQELEVRPAAQGLLRCGAARTGHSRCTLRAQDMVRHEAREWSHDSQDAWPIPGTLADRSEDQGGRVAE